MIVKVIEKVDVSELFPVTNGVNHGCVLALTLFSFLFCEILSSALCKANADIKITFWTDGHLFNLQYVTANTKVN